MASRTLLTTQVATWIDNLAAHEVAVERIGALGHAAIEPLHAYLQNGPQTVSQARELAVRMLARLQDIRVPPILREVIYTHPLHALAPYLVESELRVKNLALELLVADDADDLAALIDFGLRSERLPAAVTAVGTLGLQELVPPVAALLTDDVLAAPALQTLRRLGKPARVPMIRQVTAWLDQVPQTSRQRLALIRACLVLEQMDVALPTLLHQRLQQQPSMLVRAAAALDTRAGVGAAAMESLVSGMLGTHPQLATACRQVLSRQPVETWVDMAMRALQRDAERDIYNNLQASDAAARSWLLRQILPRMATHPSGLQALMAAVTPIELALAIRHGRRDIMPAMPVLLTHADAEVRLAVVRAMARLGDDEAPRWLVRLLTDTDRRVRRRAWLALVRRARSSRGLTKADLPLAVAWRSPFLWLRLRRLVQRVP